MQAGLSCKDYRATSSRTSGHWQSQQRGCRYMGERTQDFLVRQNECATLTAL